LKNSVGIPKSLQECGVNEATFYEQLNELAEQAFDDQCTGTNPRYPLISDLKQLIEEAYYESDKHKRMVTTEESDMDLIDSPS